MTKKPHPIDLHVGQSLRSFRKLRRITQTEAAQKLGISFQQMQKYECGSNRISASRLYEISELLGVRLSDFFPESSQGSIGPAITTDEHELIAAYRATPPEIRAAIRSLTQSAGGAA